MLLWILGGCEARMQNQKPFRAVYWYRRQWLGFIGCMQMVSAIDTWTYQKIGGAVCFDIMDCECGEKLKMTVELHF